MKFEEAIDIEKLKSHISDIGARSAINHAKDMAYDIASTLENKNSISSTHKIYNELEDIELGVEQALSAIKSMFSDLATSDEKKRFCSYSYPTLRI
mgnify:CR=1 FL=1